jgi:hypothetical protein
LENGARSWFDLMRAGDFESAWKLSDRDLGSARATQSERTPRHLQRIWDGAPLADRRVLVRCYHGLGDTLQFVRFLPRLAATARSVSLWAQPALLDLFDNLWPTVELLPLHDGVPKAAFDVDVEVMELAHVFRITPDTIPAEVPYLRVPGSPPRPGRPCSRKPTVGIVWRGGGWDMCRSVPFVNLAPLFARDDITLVPLQDALTPDEARCLPRWRRVAPPARLARVLATVDLLITVDTMAAHLAGALAVPTWLLLHADPDWRWMIDRDDTPWYPTMRLFRLCAQEEWPALVARVMQELDRLTARSADRSLRRMRSRAGAMAGRTG